jgi:hypothetical protein
MHFLRVICALVDVITLKGLVSMKEWGFFPRLLMKHGAHQAAEYEGSLHRSQRHLHMKSL